MYYAIITHVYSRDVIKKIKIAVLPIKMNTEYLRFCMYT